MVSHGIAGWCFRIVTSKCGDTPHSISPRPHAAWSVISCLRSRFSAIVFVRQNKVLLHPRIIEVVGQHTHHNALGPAGLIVFSRTSGIYHNVSNFIQPTALANYHKYLYTITHRKMFYVLKIGPRYDKRIATTARSKKQ